MESEFWKAVEGVILILCCLQEEKNKLEEMEIPFHEEITWKSGIIHPAARCTIMVEALVNPFDFIIQLKGVYKVSALYPALLTKINNST